VVAERLAALVDDESALEACICDDVLYKLTIFTFHAFNQETLCNGVFTWVIDRL